MQGQQQLSGRTFVTENSHLFHHGKPWQAAGQSTVTLSPGFSKETVVLSSATRAQPERRAPLKSVGNTTNHVRFRRSRRLWEVHRRRGICDRPLTLLTSSQNRPDPLSGATYKMNKPTFTVSSSPVCAKDPAPSSDASWEGELKMARCDLNGHLCGCGRVPPGVAGRGCSCSFRATAVTGGSTVVLSQPTFPVASSPVVPLRLGSNEACTAVTPPRSPHPAPRSERRCGNPFNDADRSPESHPPLDDWLKKPVATTPVRPRLPLTVGQKCSAQPDCRSQRRLVPPRSFYLAGGAWRLL